MREAQAWQVYDLPILDSQTGWYFSRSLVWPGAPTRPNPDVIYILIYIYLRVNLPRCILVVVCISRCHVVHPLFQVFPSVFLLSKLIILKQSVEVCDRAGDSLRSATPVHSSLIRPSTAHGHSRVAAFATAIALCLQLGTASGWANHSFV